LFSKKICGIEIVDKKAIVFPIEEYEEIANNSRKADELT